MNWMFWIWLFLWIGWGQSFVRSVPPMVRSRRYDKRSKIILDEMVAHASVLASGVSSVEEREHHEREFENTSVALDAVFDQWKMELEHARKLNRRQFIWLGFMLLALFFLHIT